MKANEAIGLSRIGVAVRWWETGNNDFPYYATKHSHFEAVSILESRQVMGYNPHTRPFNFLHNSYEEDWSPIDPKAPLELLADCAD